MTRTTDSDLRRAERLANRAMALAGSRTRYLAQRRNGRVGIDVYRAADSADCNVITGRGQWELRDVLRAGLTTREALLVLECIAEAVDVFAYWAVITWPNNDPR
jgi:hypothetical protein